MPSILYKLLLMADNYMPTRVNLKKISMGFYSLKYTILSYHIEALIIYCR